VTLQWQQVEVNLGASMEQSTTPFVLPTNFFQELRNARVYKTGSVGKRPGWQAKAPTSGDRVLSVDGDLFTLKAHTPFSNTAGAALELGTLDNDASRIDYHGGSLGTWSLSEVEILERRVIMRDVFSGDGSGTFFSTDPDFAVSADQTVAVVAWEVALPLTPSGPAQNVVMAMAIDVKTRALVTPPTQVSTSAGACKQPFVLLNDASTIVVIWAAGTPTTQVRGVTYNTTTRAFGVDTVIVNDLSNGGGFPRFDAREYVGGTGWFLAYQNTTPVLAFAQVNGVTVASSSTIAENPDGGAIAVYADSATATLWLGWFNTVNGVRAAIRSATALGTVVLAPTTMEVLTSPARQMTWAPGRGGIGSTNILIWTLLTSVAGAYNRPTSKFRTLDQAGTKGSVAACADVQLISKGYSAPNGFTYAAFLYDGSEVDVTNVAALRSQQNQVAFTMMVCDTQLAVSGLSSSWRVAGVWAYGEAGRQRRPSSLSAFRAVTIDAQTTEQWFMNPTEFNIVPVGGFPGTITGHPGVDLCRQRITTMAPIYAARIGGLVVFSGGVPQIWDGANLVEYGFFYPPENSKVTDVVGGGFLSAGIYSDQVVWEYRHANGDVARSAPSFSMVTPGVTSVTAALSDQLSVAFPSLGNTRKFNESSNAEGVIARVYRTEANGTIWYFEGDIQTASGFVASKVSIAGGFLLTATVKQGDSDIIIHPKVYTTDDLLPNFPPPALAYIHVHRNRLFGIAAENRRQVFFTHEYNSGELPGWHADLVIDVPDECVGLATVDEKLIILCRTGIYLISGNGPDRKGLNSDYDQPFRLNSPHGCITAASIVNFPNGVIYQAETGFCLVDRKTSVTRIGGPVEDVVSSFPYAQGNAVLEDREWIYWPLTDQQFLEASTDGRMVCFDWRHNVWSLDQITFNGSGSYITSLATRGTDVFCAITGDPTVYQQGGSADPGPGWIYTYFKTAMLNLGSNSKYQRTRWLSLLGRQLGIHRVLATVTTFHHAASAGFSQSFGWTETQLSAMQNYALKMHLKNQVGAFVQIEIQDGPDLGFPGIFGDSAQFVTLLLELGLKRGTFQASTAAMR
jgi:hypothetical protein